MWIGMLDKSPEASLRGLRRAASAIAFTSPRKRDRSPSSMFLQPFDSVFFMSRSKLRLQGWLDRSAAAIGKHSAQSLVIVNGGYAGCQTVGSRFFDEIWMNFDPA